MADDLDTSTRTKRSPWSIALREARAIGVAAVLIAVAFNLLAATGIGWKYTPRAKSNQDSVFIPGADSASTPATTPIDTAGAQTIDTAATIDTTADAAAKARADSIARAKEIADSVAKARMDSIRKATAGAKPADSVVAPEGGTPKQALIAKAAGMAEIQTDMAKGLFDMKAALFIDARPEDHYRESHIPGAMNCYAEQWQSKIGELIKIPKDVLIVCYCGGGDECELSHDLADHLRELGYKKVTVYKGGIKEWTAKKYPLAGSK